MEFLGTLLMIVGFIIGLGAVTVIDIHGFLGRKSSYWTGATTRTHKVTKPLIWIGTIVAIVGGIILYLPIGWNVFSATHFVLAIILILNGCFLSFKVSPFLLERERNSQEKELLPKSWQNKIITSFIVSFIGWWGSVVLFVFYLFNSLHL